MTSQNMTSTNVTSQNRNSKKKKIALILSGCGHQDGSEITEAVSLLISLDQAGATVNGFAPDLLVPEQNHLTHQKTASQRNALVESARLLRGQVKNLSTLSAQDFDGLCLAGGFGAASVLSDWATAGPQCQLQPEVRNAITDFYRAGKPIAAVCVAPVLLARVLGEKKISLTVGSKSATSEQVQKTGAIHVECPVDDFITDREHKIITSPAYMYDSAFPSQVFKGISGLAKELVEMA
jgi:enhancing lycopene biosynthesis protein 2